MPYAETKVYSDGSHYIAIPKTTRPARRNNKPRKQINDHLTVTDTEQTTRKEINPKDEFDRLYRENGGKRKAEKVTNLTEGMKPYFKTENDAELFVRENIERKKRNAIVRKTRLARKVNLQEWNWFCTFTFDDKKHTEQSFRKSLSNCMKHLSSRKQWKYIGVWERSPEKQRLHFHGMFYIPENAMIGELAEHRDYSTKNRKIQTTLQNTHFNEKYGRSDFEPIASKEEIQKSKAYLMKYIEKSGERIVYSKDLPTYFISDVMDEDIVCAIGQEDRKLLLFDDFNCWDEGCLIGKVSSETIRQLRKSN